MFPICQIWIYLFVESLYQSYEKVTSAIIPVSHSETCLGLEVLGVEVLASECLQSGPQIYILNYHTVISLFHGVCISLAFTELQVFF